jgi:hypothetical protein
MIVIEIFERGCAQQYSPDQPRGPRFAHDSLLEGSGFELSVPLGGGGFEPVLVPVGSDSEPTLP